MSDKKLKGTSKVYQATLWGTLRKEVELYIAANQLKEADAIRDLLRAGIERKNHPFFKCKTL